MSGHLYQLRSKTELHKGAYVEVNGPHDRFGIVWKSEKEGDSFLNLIRGVPKDTHREPVCKF